jgi:hypothetical protein
VSIVTFAACQLHAQQPRALRTDQVRLRSQQSAEPQTASPDKKATGTYITISIAGAFVEGINPQGDIVGGYFDSSGIWQNFLLSNGKYTLINPPDAAPCCWAGGWLSTEIGINAQGDIVASYSNGANGGAAPGFLFSRGQYASINPPGAGCFGTIPAGINASGDIVGWYFDNGGGCGLHGFLLRKGAYTNIDVPAALGAAPGSTAATAVNDRGDITGSYSDGSGNTHGFLLSGGTFSSFDISEAAFTYPFGLSAEGDIVGWACCGSIGGFLLSNGEVSAIGFPGAGSPNTPAYGINAPGDIVGIYFDNSGNQHGFLLTKN